jgi:hypothetical protein
VNHDPPDPSESAEIKSFIPIFYGQMVGCFEIQFLISQNQSLADLIFFQSSNMSFILCLFLDLSYGKNEVLKIMPITEVSRIILNLKSRYS